MSWQRRDNPCKVLTMDNPRSKRMSAIKQKLTTLIRAFVSWLRKGRSDRPKPHTIVTYDGQMFTGSLASSYCTIWRDATFEWACTTCGHVHDPTDELRLRRERAAWVEQQLREHRNDA